MIAAPVGATGPAWDGIPTLSDLSYHCAMAGMKGITIKLPEATMERLKRRALASGRSVAALIRERVEDPAPHGDDRTVYTATADLAGALDGPRRAATSARRRFRRP